MAVTADRVVVELEARLDKYEANVARAETKFDRAMSGIQKSAGATEAFVARAMGGITGALAGVSVIALARAFLTISDEAKKLDAQLRLATQGFGSFGQAQKDVQRIADETRSGLTETAALYGNFVRGAKELGATQAEAARATETFSKTLKISGADTNEAASATLQFGQALAAGALRGDELNSILEASPRLARLLAESMGQPIGQIKQLGEQGLLTSDKLLKALTDTKFTAGIDAEFKEIPLTFDDAMTRVYNAALTTFSAFDQGGEFSSTLASFVGDGADGFSDLAKAAEDMGIEVRSTLAGLANAFDPLLQGGLSVFEQLGGKAFDLQEFIRATLRDADRLLNIGPGIANYFGANGKYDSRLLQNYDARQRQEQQRLTGQANERRFRFMIGGYDVMGNPLPGTPAAGRSTASSTPSSSGKKTRTPKSPLNPEAFAREEAALNDQILRLKGDELTNAGDRAKAELDRIEASKQAAVKEVEQEKRYTPEQKKKIIALTETVAALEAGKVIYERDVQAAKEALDIRIGDLRNQEDLLRAQTDLADTREKRRDLELRLLDLAYQQEKAELEAVIASKDASDAQKKIAQARLNSLGQIQGAKVAGVNQQYESPLDAYLRRQNQSSTSDKVEDLVVQELDYVQDGIRNAITKRLGIKDPFLAGILDIFIQQNIMRPLAEALANVGGGGGGLLGGIVSGVGSILGFASGGSGTLGGRGGTDTNVLSLNGRPFANVSRGETLSVGSKTLKGGNSPTVVQPIIQVDARGAVMNDQFAQMILAQANQGAIHAAASMGQAINRNIPSRLATFQRDGT